MNNRGLTLTELIVVITIVSVVMVSFIFSYSEWMGRYKVEKATRELHTDLMIARERAMTRNTKHFADFNFPLPPSGYGTYRVAEDTDDDSEGDDNADGVIDAAGHTFLQSFSKTVEYPITNNFKNKIINFDERGLVQPRGQSAGGTICIFSDKDPDYDCIVISMTRISIGKLIRNPGDCNSSNCQKK